MVATGVEHDDSLRLAEANARVGSTLRGKWKLDALLGLGGMAAVYAATHRNGMRGAVKLLDPVLGRNDHMRERFLREGYLANSVNHPAAVLVLDDDTTEDGSVYLVMELLEGRTLEELAAGAGGKLPVREVLDAMAQLLDALSHAHARGIVHRDIKPDNLFLTANGTLKVLDFGIARLLESEMALSTTQTGSPMGTPAFMSPEQARGRTKLVDAQSDLYSVGATMFTLLSGELVHGNDITISEYVAAAFTNQARPVASVVADVPAVVASVVDRALRLDKSERWPSAAAMLEALGAAYVTTYGEELPPPPPVAPRVSRSSLVSMHELRSLTPVSTPPRSQRDSAETIAPPPLARKTSSRAVLFGLGAALVVAIGATVAISRLAQNKVHSDATSLPPAPVEHVATVEKTAAPPVVTQAAQAPIETAVKTSDKTPATVVKPVLTAKSARPSPTPTAAPSASASVTPPPAVPADNVYDRRY